MMRDLGISVRRVELEDSFAATGIAPRRGLEKVKHVDVRKMRIQYVVRPEGIAIVEIPGCENAADVLTRHPRSPAHGAGA